MRKFQLYPFNGLGGNKFISESGEITIQKQCIAFKPVERAKKFSLAHGVFNSK
jgi:hypothetical protein